MTRPETLKGSATLTGPAAKLLDDDEIDRLIAEQSEDGAATKEEGEEE